MDDIGAAGTTGRTNGEFVIARGAAYLASAHILHLLILLEVGDFRQFGGALRQVNIIFVGLRVPAINQHAVQLNPLEGIVGV